MACRFLGSVLLLFLTTFGQHVTATRYGGRSIHSEQSEVSPRSYKPAASRYDGHVLPRSSLGSYSFAEKASPRSYSTLAAASRQSGSYGRHGDGPAHAGSFSSYRPTSSWSPKPRETPQQPRKDGHLSKTSMSANPSPQNRREFGSRIVTKPVQEQQPSLKATARQQPASTRLQDGAFGSKVQSSNRNGQLAAHLRGPRPVDSSSFSKVQQPHSGMSGVHQSSKGLRGTVPLSESRFSSSSTLDRVPAVYPTAKPVRQSSSSVHQSNGGLRGATSSSMLSPTLTKQTSTHPRLPQMTSRYFSRVELPSSESTGELQPKRGMRDSAVLHDLSRVQPPSSSRVQAPSSSRVQPPSSNSGDGVLQTKEGMWASAFPETGNDLKSVFALSHRTRLHSTAKPPRRESHPSVSSKELKADMWTGDFNHNVWPRPKLVPAASRFSFERQQPQLAAVSSRSRQPSAY